MTLTADSSGVIRGKFNIPSGVPAGTKLVSFNGAGGQRGDAVFSGQGTLEHQTWQRRTTVTTTRWQSPPPPVLTPEQIHFLFDPLAQTFTMEANTQIAAVDLWFVVKSTTPTRVQIRDTIAGLPSSRVIAEAIVQPGAINLGGASTTLSFPAPVLLLGNVEYAILVICDDAVGAVSVAEIGKFDPTAQKWITDQPYIIGVLLSSSNSSTWTPHQDRDLTFRLLSANYTETSRTVDLGDVAVAAATDLLLMSYAERPDGATDVEYRLTLPDASVITVDDGQPIKLAAPVTGNIGVQAVLRGTSRFSPVLTPGSQLVVGKVATTGDYVTRAIPGGSNVAVKAVYEAFVPSGATVTVQYRGPDAGDTWTNVPQTATRAVDDGFVEFTHSITGVNEQSVQIKLILSGNTAARPRVRDLRTFVM